MRKAAALLLLALATLAAPPLATVSARPPEAAGEVAGLQDILEKGLRARLPQDFAFIGKVVAMVRNNQLPRELVLGAFDWVRKNRANKTYKMPYFERVLRIRAREIGVTI